MRKEIGSEFWDIPVSSKNNNFFPDNTIWFLSGRVALRQIIKDILKKNKVQSVSLPSWCCESMIIPFLEEGFQIEFYDVYGNEQLIWAVNTDVILIMDYFGYTGYSKLYGYSGIVIRDITHSLFSESYDDADYYFGSLRKWAGFLTGGFAWGIEENRSGNKIGKQYIELRKKAMNEKSVYIKGLSNSKEYLNIYQKAEKYLETVSEIELADSSDIQFAQKLDINFIKIRRRKNATCLLKEFKNIAIFKELKENDCPMFVPIIVPDEKRDKLRQYLVEHRIYCPIHWSVSKFHQLNVKTRYIYENSLSLVCDQRYTEKNMNYMINIINRFLKE